MVDLRLISLRYCSEVVSSPDMWSGGIGRVFLEIHRTGN
jgi:hypothetical protein